MNRDELGELRRGDLVLVRWLDASDIRCSIEEHEIDSEIYCKDWGVFLGVSGRKHKLIIVGKDVVELQNEWGATRIPLNLVEEVKVILPRDEVVKAITEIRALGRRIRLRRYVQEGISRVQVA